MVRYLCFGYFLKGHNGLENGGLEWCFRIPESSEGRKHQMTNIFRILESLKFHILRILESQNLQNLHEYTRSVSVKLLANTR